MIIRSVPQTSLYKGSSSTPIVFAEIVPLVLISIETERDCDEDGAESPKQHIQQQHLLPLTNFGVKQFLLRETREADLMEISDFASGSANGHHLFIEWEKNDDDDDDDHVSGLSTGCVFQNEQNQVNVKNCLHDEGKFPLVYIPSENPTIIKHQPCCIIAYAYRNHVVSPSHRGLAYDETKGSICHISEDTMIRILPPRLATSLLSFDRRVFGSVSEFKTSSSLSFHFRQESMLSDLIGEQGNNSISNELLREVLQNHNKETIQELSLKMSAALTSVKIGTTFNAFRAKEKLEKRMKRMEQSICLLSGSSFQKTTVLTGEISNDTGLQSWPSLIVHSPSHADGKTLLVYALAKRLGCSSIHLICPGALVAKYGIRADSALESQLHAILMSAACRSQKVCVILDQLDMILPARQSGRTSSGDATIPILNAISSYLRKVTYAMQRRREVPFPLKNPLYNPTSCNGSSGQVFGVKLCLVGIVTCPDDGWSSHGKNNGGSASDRCSILDCMIADRYRIPLLTSKTILSAFEAAFAREGITLEASAKTRLALIARSAQWAKGSIFRRVAKQLKLVLMCSSPCLGDSSAVRTEAVVQDLEKALALVNPKGTGSGKVDNSLETECSRDVENTLSRADFGLIGGNEDAKVSLEDALAFDRGKREILFRFGLSPPTGVLLYGPPGCGKTLLAKAVARLFKSPVSGTARSPTQGGTFISLSISEIVSAEVGTSEKTIASTFEFAERNAPSVIFLDEFQALFTDRSRGSGGKLTTVLLQCLDDIKRWCETEKFLTSDQTTSTEGGKRVVVIAATNTPWMIDSAFLRPGRFDRVVHVGLPSLSDRKSILQLHIEKMRFRDGDDIDTISDLCDELSTLTEGFTGADVAALCRAAAVRALGQGDGISVDANHFKDALKLDVFPSSDNILVKRLKAWRP